MSLHNPLPEIWEAFLYAKDALRITRRLAIPKWELRNEECRSTITAYQTKQVYEYRNWVAHGKNPEKRPSINVQPDAAYNTLDTIINRLSLHVS